MNPRRFLLALGAALSSFVASCVTTVPQPAAPVTSATASNPVGSVSQTPAPVSPTTAAPSVRLVAVGFNDVPGWRTDAVLQALPALKRSCSAMAIDLRWKPFCDAIASAQIATDDALRAIIETYLLPQQAISTSGSNMGMVTGYYEPFLRGSRKKVAPYLTPLYRVPADLIDVDLSGELPETRGLRLRGKLVGKKIVPYPSRAELDASKALAGSEIVWVDDAVDAFFLQIQGSGRVQIFEHGKPVGVIRLAYANQNGQPYRSIGKWLIEQHELLPNEASMQGIKNWVARHPEQQTQLFEVNPSVVFFKEEAVLDPAVGPKGAQGVPLSDGRSAAIDAQVVPLGAPVFLSSTEPNSDTPMQKLLVAQDTGSAIVTAPGTAVRMDLYFGSGDAAGDAAGRMKQSGQMWVLLPRDQKPPS